MGKRVFRFYQFINERYYISNLPSNIIMLSKKDNEHFLLYDKVKKKPVGYISFGLYPEINSYTVGGVFSERGYGAFLYESAMTKVYPNGLSMSRDGSTSGDALNVWEKFDKRSDVKKERMYSDELTHKKEDLPGSWYSQKEIDRILELEDTRFFYTYGRDKLERLLDIGKQYMIDNNISDNDIEYMSWDLE